MLNVVRQYLLKKAIPLVAPKSWPGLKPPQGVDKFHEEHEQTVSGDSLSSLNAYGGTTYSMINKHLRGQRLSPIVNLSRIEEDIDNIDDALDKSRLTRATVLWRGIAHAPGHPLFKRLEQLDGEVHKLKGFRFVEHAYMSTSLNRSLAESFMFERDGEDVLFKIYAPIGTPALSLRAAHALLGRDIKEFEGARDEHEVLLDRGLTFEVVSAVQDKHYLVVVLDIL